MYTLYLRNKNSSDVIPIFFSSDREIIRDADRLRSYGHLPRWYGRGVSTLGRGSGSAKYDKQVRLSDSRGSKRPAYREDIRRGIRQL